jgi:hypothetical protein
MVYTWLLWQLLLLFVEMLKFSKNIYFRKTNILWMKIENILEFFKEYLIFQYYMFEIN